MICPKCGKKMIYIERDYAPDTFDCECGEWIEVSIAFNEMKAQKEKVEGELKAIKARIEAVTEAEAFKIVDLVVKNCVRDNTVMSYREHISKAVVNLIKQIGGEK